MGGLRPGLQICGVEGVCLCPVPRFRVPWLCRKAPELGIQVPPAGHRGHLISAPHAHVGAVVSTPGFLRPDFSPPWPLCGVQFILLLFQDACCFSLRAENFFFFFKHTSFLLISQLSLGLRMWLQLTKARRFQN